jgi:imidazoleglycerol-phosphate dehydratase / histidinol-phosphatase
MKKILFIDRDGTIIREPADQQIDSLDKLEFLPGAISGLARIARELDFLLVMVSNQDGLGTSSFPEGTFWPAHQKMLDILAGEGIHWSEILIDRSFAHEGLPTRKPGTALLTHYMKGHYDLAKSFVIGDRLTDVQLADNLGCQAIYIGDPVDRAALCTRDWAEIFRFLQGQARTADVHRKTSETDIRVKVDLDSGPRSQIHTGLGFFDHMLEQISRHGEFGLEIAVRGDLHIDEHHTIEDTALALGQAIKEALGTRRGIARYGFLLPMDDCLAQVAIDLGGRPWTVWDAEFKREKIGEMPTEMFFHFFKSFSDAAGCNLNIRVEGDNEHHKIESIFKAFARALGMAIRRTGDAHMPSTKGTLA